MMNFTKGSSNGIPVSSKLLLPTVIWRSNRTFLFIEHRGQTGDPRTNAIIPFPIHFITLRVVPRGRAGRVSQRVPDAGTTVRGCRRCRPAGCGGEPQPAAAG